MPCVLNSRHYFRVCRYEYAMKKKLKTALAVLVIAVLFVPIPKWYKDGGTFSLDAVAWSVTKVHSLCDGPDVTGGCDIGTHIRILFWTVYDDVEYYPDAQAL